MVGGERFNVQLCEADVGAAEVRKVPPAAVHNGGHGDNFGSMLPHDSDGFHHASAPGDDIFGDEELVARVDLKPAPENELVIFLFGENVRQAKVPGNFVPDNQAAQCG